MFVFPPFFARKFLQDVAFVWFALSAQLNRPAKRTAGIGPLFCGPALSELKGFLPHCDWNRNTIRTVLRSPLRYPLRTRWVCVAHPPRINVGDSRRGGILAPPTRNTGGSYKDSAYRRNHLTKTGISQSPKKGRCAKTHTGPNRPPCRAGERGLHGNRYARTATGVSVAQL